jgi:hypothetical protein
MMIRPREVNMGFPVRDRLKISESWKRIIYYSAFERESPPAESKLLQEICKNIAIILDNIGHLCNLGQTVADLGQIIGL